MHRQMIRKQVALERLQTVIFIAQVNLAPVDICLLKLK